jgi:hypothetical protein
MIVRKVYVQNGSGGCVALAILKSARRYLTGPLDLELKQYMHGRKNSERADSVTTTMLQQRKEHLNRLESISVSECTVKRLKKMGLGSKRKKYQVYNNANNENATAAGIV